MPATGTAGHVLSHADAASYEAARLLVESGIPAWVVADGLLSLFCLSFAVFVSYLYAVMIDRKSGPAYLGPLVLSLLLWLPAMAVALRADDIDAAREFNEGHGLSLYAHDYDVVLADPESGTVTLSDTEGEEAIRTVPLREAVRHAGKPTRKHLSARHDLPEPAGEP